jgi:hypothetical protein
MTAVDKAGYTPRVPLHLRFWSKVQLSDGCWNWTGATSTHGYGTLTIGVDRGVFKREKATRVMWFLRYGSWPRAHILHSCDNPHCVNPKHLSEGDDRENTLQCVDRGRHFNAKKTHCKNGHPFDSVNSYTRGSERICRTCRRTRSGNRRSRCSKN